MKKGGNTGDNGIVEESNKKRDFKNVSFRRIVKKSNKNEDSKGNENFRNVENIKINRNNKANENLKNKESKKNNEINEYYEKIVLLDKKIQNANEEIIPYCDGKIIGDGRSDYTRDVTEYEIEYNSEKFCLLDLPGIEGNEELVLENINKAVKKSHAVFYISASPNPPQSGDKENSGTIEKIKQHLGDQTEVYFLYNKKIKV